MPALLIQGFGQGLGLTPLVGTIVSRVHSRDAGAAAGVVATSFQVGNVLGIAVVGLVFFLFLGLQSAVSSHALQYVASISGTLPFIAALALVPYGLVFLLPRAEAEGSDVLLERLPQKANRPERGLLFVCQNCHYTLHADLVGARNVTLRTLLVRQDWMSTGVLSVRPDVSSDKAKAARRQRYAELRWSLDTSPSRSTGRGH